MLLDTHVLLWLRWGEQRMGPVARARLDQAWDAGDIYVAAVSFWEVELLKRKGRIRFPGDVGQWRDELLAQGVIEIPLNGAIGIRTASLPDFHADPADRMIVATALEGYELVTADRSILDWPGRVKRLDATT